MSLSILLTIKRSRPRKYQHNLSFLDQISSKVLSLQKATLQVNNWKENKEKIVFTNGCFDLLHYGHIQYLTQARDLGDKLVIGLNSSTSVKRLKGNHRPINDDKTRIHLLASLSFVDLIVVFEEDTPLELIKSIQPDILVKGGDYTPEKIVGFAEVKSNGGEVEVLTFAEGYSTTQIENKIKNSL